MVLPMKKVSLVVMENEREESLKKLRKLGVAHIERKDVSSAHLTKLLHRKAEIEKALGILSFYAEDKKTKKIKSGKLNSGVLNADSLIEKVLEYMDQKKVLMDGLADLGRERNHIEEWGNFNPGDIAFIAEKCGLNIFLYKSFPETVKNFPEARYIILGGNKDFIRLVVFGEKLPGLAPVIPGEYSLDEIDLHISIVRKRLSDIETEMAVLAEGRGLAENELKKLLVNIEFETVKAGMDVLEDAHGELRVAWITAYVPLENLEMLKKGAAENCWALGADDPGPDDPVPTKLKNNRMVNLINPLMNFLDIVPGYNEPDVSGWFLIFFSLFFGMIYGDAAYGAIIMIAGIIGIVKNIKKGVAPVFKLMLLLGTSNFIWGVLTCSWLGLDVNLLPQALRQISLPLISNITAVASDYGNGIVRQNMMIFCFTLAILQLSIGHIIAISRCRNLKILADIGFIAMLLGMYGVVLNLIASNEYRQIPFFQPCAYLIGIGFVLVFVFANYDGSIGKSAIEGCKNSISMFLGIANVFGDIMSYIRLWAVGLAGAAISSTVNSMAGPMLGHLIFFIFGVVLLVFGHSLNIVLNALSVLVHGVRLNILEFSGHVGLTWSGTAYKPFKENE